MRTGPWSYSKLRMLSRCGEQFFRRWVLGHLRPPTLAMVTGAATDRAVAAMVEAAIAARPQPTTAELAEMSRAALRVELNAAGEVEDAAGADRAALEERAAPEVELFAGGFKALVLPTIGQPTHSRRAFEVAFAGYPAIEGVIDVQSEEPAGIRVGNVATTRRRPNAATADESLQLKIHQLGVRALEGRWPARVVLDYLVLREPTRKRPTLAVDHEPIDATVEDQPNLRPLLARLEAAEKVVEAGSFMPADPGAIAAPCGWCGYRHDCRYYTARPRSIAAAAATE